MLDSSGWCTENLSIPQNIAGDEKSITAEPGEGLVKNPWVLLLVDIIEDDVEFRLMKYTQ
ncbi:MAG: hypothetical protein ACP5JH_05620 [Bacteroidota bacterium]